MQAARAPPHRQAWLSETALAADLNRLTINPPAPPGADLPCQLDQTDHSPLPTLAGLPCQLGLVGHNCDLHVRPQLPQRGVDLQAEGHEGDRGGP